jgi:hypothetical protein
MRAVSLRLAAIPRRGGVLLSVGGMLMLWACATPPPEEFTVYQMAFAEADQATEEFVRTWSPLEKAARRPDTAEFDPNFAGYYVDDAPTGLGALIERGFAAVARYNEVVVRYAAGESVGQLRPALSSFATDGAAIAGLVGLTPVGAALGPAVAGLESLAGALLAAADRAAFQAAVTRHAGTVSAFLVELRAQTPLIYSTARSEYGQRETRLLAEGRNAEADQTAADLQRFRRMLASWVLLLDQLDRSVKALEQAVIRDKARPLVAADVAYWTSDIRRHAEAVKLAARMLSGAL